MPRTSNFADALLVALMGLLIFGLAFLNVWQFLSPKGKPTCSSFGSYQDALDSFDNGNKKLDWDGDGIPCEDLRKAELTSR